MKFRLSRRQFLSRCLGRMVVAGLLLAMKSALELRIKDEDDKSKSD